MSWDTRKNKPHFVRRVRKFLSSLARLEQTFGLIRPMLFVVVWFPIWITDRQSLPSTEEWILEPRMGWFSCVSFRALNSSQWVDTATLRDVQPLDTPFLRPLRGRALFLEGVTAGDHHQIDNPEISDTGKTSQFFSFTGV